MSQKKGKKAVAKQGSKTSASRTTSPPVAQVKAESKPAYRVVKIGTVAIDTGHIVFVDPCRVDEVHDHFDGPLDLAGQLGQFVVGSQTGLGDGKYPVFAEIVNDEHFGERVMALHMHFDPMYSFCDTEHIEEEEAKYLAFMNEA